MVWQISRNKKTFADYPRQEEAKVEAVVVKVVPRLEAFQKVVVALQASPLVQLEALMVKSKR